MKQIHLILLFTVATFLGQNVRSEILRSSQIVGYNSGDLGVDAGTGTLEGWSRIGGNGLVTLTNGSGSLDGTGLGLVISAGDRIFISATDRVDSARNQFATNTVFPQTVETNLYFSFLYKFRDAAAIPATGRVMIRVNRANSGATSPQHWDLDAKNVAGAIQVGIAKAGGNVTNYAATNLTVGQPFFVVVRQHIIPSTNNDVYTLWINPPREFFGTNELNLPPADATVGTLATDGTEDASGTGPGRFVISSGVNAEMDEVRITTSWADATPPLGQCLPASVSSDPASVSQSAEISATLTVQAGGTSPTYQWQRSTNSGGNWFNIPGATTFTYTTPNLAFSESGSQYRAIIHVACDNSSATSAVATITLSAPIPTPLGIVMDDTFLDPDLGFDDRANPPLSSSNSLWYTATTDNLTAFGQGGNMLGTPLAGGSSLWLGYFTDTNQPPVHLAVGRALKVTLPFVPNSFGFHTNNSGLRVGLFDYYDGGARIIVDGPNVGGSRGNGGGVRGYMLNLDFGTNFTANSPLQLLGRSFLADDNLMGTIGDFQSFGSGPAGGGYTNAPAFQAGGEYTLEFTVVRTAVNSANITANISGGGTNWSHSVTDTNFAYHRFDSFAIRPNSLETSADSFTFHEFKVEVLAPPLTVPPFRLTAIQSLAPDAIKLTWDSVAGATYYVLSRDTITGPDVTNATIVATGSSTSYTNTPIAGPQRFFRILAPPYVQ
jgi:hypothetical protein